MDAGGNACYRHGHGQRGWQEADEEIGYWFIKALRRGYYDRALEMAPTEEGLADWPAGRHGADEAPRFREQSTHA